MALRYMMEDLYFMKKNIVKMTGMVFKLKQSSRVPGGLIITATLINPKSRLCT